jgi:hypothetical protein
MAERLTDELPAVPLQAEFDDICAVRVCLDCQSDPKRCINDRHRQMIEKSFSSAEFVAVQARSPKMWVPEMC